MFTNCAFSSILLTGSSIPLVSSLQEESIVVSSVMNPKNRYFRLTLSPLNINVCIKLVFTQGAKESNLTDNSIQFHFHSHLFEIQYIFMVRFNWFYLLGKQCVVTKGAKLSCWPLPLCSYKNEGK